MKEQRLHWVARQSSAQCAKNPCLSGLRFLFVEREAVHSKNGLTGTSAGYSRTPLALDNYRRLNLSDAWIKKGDTT